MVSVRLLFLFVTIVVVLVIASVWISTLYDSVAYKSQFLHDGNGSIAEQGYNEGSTRVRQCHMWCYDASEYTLTYKKDTYATLATRCRHPNRTVKLVVYPNATQRLTGCTKLTSRCKERPHYDMKLQKRINTPPCCRQHMIDMYAHLANELRENQIEHTMIFGAILGWYRNRKFVPYDTDLDVMINGTFWRGELMTNILERLTTLHNYTFYFADNNMKLRMYYSRHNENLIDIWPFYVKENNVDIPHDDFRALNKNDVFPIQQVLINGDIPIRVPRNPKRHLLAQYGEETKWTVELSCKIVQKYGVCAPV